MGKSDKNIKSDRIKTLRKQYDLFLEEDKRRKERNEYILGRLDSMRNCKALIQTRNIFGTTTLPHYVRNDYVSQKVTKVEKDIANQSTASGAIARPAELQTSDNFMSQLLRNYILVPKFPKDQPESTFDHLPSKVVNNDLDHDWRKKYDILEQLLPNRVQDCSLDTPVKLRDKPDGIIKDSCPNESEIKSNNTTKLDENYVYQINQNSENNEKYQNEVISPKKSLSTNFESINKHVRNDTRNREDNDLNEPLQHPEEANVPQNIYMEYDPNKLNIVENDTSLSNIDNTYYTLDENNTNIVEDSTPTNNQIYYPLEENNIQTEASQEISQNENENIIQENYARYDTSDVNAEGNNCTEVKNDIDNAKTDGLDSISNKDDTDFENQPENIDINTNEEIPITTTNIQEISEQLEEKSFDIKDLEAVSITESRNVNLEPETASEPNYGADTNLVGDEIPQTIEVNENQILQEQVLYAPNLGNIEGEGYVHQEYIQQGNLESGMQEYSQENNDLYYAEQMNYGFNASNEQTNYGYNPPAENVYNYEGAELPAQNLENTDQYAYYPNEDQVYDANYVDTDASLQQYDPNYAQQYNYPATTDAGENLETIERNVTHEELPNINMEEISNFQENIAVNFESVQQQLDNEDGYIEEAAVEKPQESAVEPESASVVNHNVVT